MEGGVAFELVALWLDAKPDKVCVVNGLSLHVGGRERVCIGTVEGYRRPSSFTAAVQAGRATEARAVKSRQLPTTLRDRLPSAQFRRETLRCRELRHEGARLFHMRIQCRKTAHRRHASIQGTMYRRWELGKHIEFNL